MTDTAAQELETVFCPLVKGACRVDCAFREVHLDDHAALDVTYRRGYVGSKHPAEKVHPSEEGCSYHCVLARFFASGMEVLLRMFDSFSMASFPHHFKDREGKPKVRYEESPAFRTVVGDPDAYRDEAES